MKYFSYRAVDLSGNVSTGTVSAEDALEIESLLSASGKSLLSCRRTYRIGMRSGGKWNRRDLIDFIFHLEQLVTAGIPLLEALEEFRRAADKKAVSTVTGKLIADIDTGKKFSEACAGHPAVFSPLVVGLLSVGEQSGTLDKVLRDLGELLKWQDETVSRVKRVMMYPAFVAVVLLVVIVFVMTWLVPGLISFVKSAGAELPWHTKALLATSDFISAYWRIIGAAMAVGYVGVMVLLKRSSTAQLRFDALVLKLPLIGAVLFKIKLARFSRCVAMMYGAGISVIDTLKLSEAVVDNKLLGSNLQQIRAEISAGKPLSDSFAGCAVLPPIVSRMVRVGESTGAIDNAFNQLGYFFDRESRESIEKLEQGIGPAMIVTVGIIMMWVVISVIGPIYDLVFGMSGQF
jgi:type IV pilus assembly protein PilC